MQRRTDLLPAESTEEREARLQLIRDHMATESTEEREARLHQMSVRQSERLAAESREEREARLRTLLSAVSWDYKEDVIRANKRQHKSGRQGCKIIRHIARLPSREGNG